VLAVLVALAAIDWDTTLLPDSLTLPLLWGGLVAAALGWSGLALIDALWGVLAGYLSLWSVYWLFKKATGKEGMGFGDFKLLAALGAWLGWQAILPIVLMASVIGAAVGIAMKVSGSLREGRYVPFGPFLAGGGVVVLLAGTERVLGWIGQR
jgi:leader peptidase (prepilin peptidase)/N-methyltransferase